VDDLLLVVAAALAQLFEVQVKKLVDNRALVVSLSPRPAANRRRTLAAIHANDGLPLGR